MATYISWWYGEGLLGFWQGILIMTEKIYSFFSVRTLVRTLFDPWKRDNYSVENASLQTRTKVLLDNIVSRLVGFIIRLMTVLIGLSITTLFFAILMIILLVWILLPLVVLFLIFNGLRVVLNG